MNWLISTALDTYTDLSFGDLELDWNDGYFTAAKEEVHEDERILVEYSLHITARRDPGSYDTPGGYYLKSIDHICATVYLLDEDGYVIPLDPETQAEMDMLFIGIITQQILTQIN